MAYDLEEQEQLAKLKEWWEKYGNLLLTALTVVLLGIAAWNGWKWYERDQAVKAAALYDELAQASKMNNATVVKESTKVLTEKFGRTVYASLASLHAARLAHEGGDLAAAQQYLEWIVNRSGRAEFIGVARVRLAGVLLDAKQYDAALKQVEGEAPTGQTVAFADRRGDVLFAMGKPAEARAAWQKALDGAEEQHPLRGLIQFKLDALPPTEKS
jgi:predicted negative regulator of RcsB-dependent stress response